MKLVIVGGVTKQHDAAESASLLVNEQKDDLVSAARHHTTTFTLLSLCNTDVTSACSSHQCHICAAFSALCQHCCEFALIYMHTYNTFWT